MRVRVADATGTTWRSWRALGNTIMASGSSAVAVEDRIVTVAQGTDQRVLTSAISNVGAGFTGWRPVAN